jgi:hypothetical protein
MSRNRLALVIGILLVLTVVLIFANRGDGAKSDAEFLAQCRDAGYDVAKCRFFLTATGHSSTAAMQMLLDATPK